jgi:hypothetical protein
MDMETNTQNSETKNLVQRLERATETSRNVASRSGESEQTLNKHGMLARKRTTNP